MLNRNLKHPLHVSRQLNPNPHKIHHGSLSTIWLDISNHPNMATCPNPVLEAVPNLAWDNMAILVWEMDLVKVQAINDWIRPTSVKSLQKFLGFANFYRRFNANFSSVVKPLTDLTKKGADVANWSSAAVSAFQELKSRFTSALTNGQTERTNQTLETYLRCFVSADQDDWVEPSDCPGVDSVVDRLQQIWAHVVDNLVLSQEEAQRFANRRRFFKVATFRFDDCFIHSWHSLDELQEVVTGNGFHFTVAKTIKRYKETCSHEDCPRKGRPRVTSASEDKFIRVTSLRNRTLTAAHIRDQVNVTQSSSSRHISTTTVKRRLCASGLHGKIAARKPLLRTGRKQKRLVWTKKHKEWTLDQWKSVLWSDESKFEIFGSNHRVFVQRRKGEQMDSTCLDPTVNHGGGGADIQAVDPSRGFTSREWARFTGRYDTAYLMQRLLDRPSPEQFSNQFQMEWPKMKELLAKAAEPKTCAQKVSECVKSVFTFNYFTEPEEDGVLDHMVKITTSMNSPFVAISCRTVCPDSPPCVGKRRYSVQEILRKQRANEIRSLDKNRTKTHEKLFHNSCVTVISKKKERRASLQPHSSRKTDVKSARRTSLLPLNLLRRSSVRPGFIVPKVRVTKAPAPTYHPDKSRRPSNVKDNTYLQIPKWRYKEVKEERKKAEEEALRKIKEAEEKKKIMLKK
ncbi:unnamed protein product [Ranitomeya imitator]|uniref:Transposase Tc1-like domain-containing protein n=1 Tax=Ranitomeya imitator TaxID=111125 RepID=A0ABN9MBL6_9NEOB|nr:unnamed protein product [Ranitomeya imitator]